MDARCLECFKSSAFRQLRHTESRFRTRHATGKCSFTFGRRRRRSASPLRCTTDFLACALVFFVCLSSRPFSVLASTSSSSSSSEHDASAPANIDGTLQSYVRSSWRNYFDLKTSTVDGPDMHQPFVWPRVPFRADATFRSTLRPLAWSNPDENGQYHVCIPILTLPIVEGELCITLQKCAFYFVSQLSLDLECRTPKFSRQ